jgi:hypothetical protein
MWANTCWGFLFLAIATGTPIVTGVSHLIDPVRDRSSEMFLFEFVPVRLSYGTEISPTLE